MSDGITDAAKMTAEAVRKFQLQYLKDIPTCYLVDELCKREGVSTIVVEPNHYFAIRVGTNSVDSCQYGASTIIVVRE
jgi:hypothetical protein